jgi:ABC-type transport system involved in multi-copper enzyme maturation permease subunit
LTGLVSWPIARVTARERGLAPATLLVAALLVLTGILGAFSELWLMVMVAILGAGALSSEVESGHAQLVLLRPITRTQWVSGRFLGIAFVLSCSWAASWAASTALSLYRSGAAGIGPQLLSLPLCLLPYLGWLATLVALSALVRGWVNVGVVVVALVAWFVARNALPLLLPAFRLAPVLMLIDGYFGPQEICRSYTTGKLVWDVAWLALAWLAAVQLFGRRELARRR